MRDQNAAVLTIDLAAVAQNYRQLADRIYPARCGAAVKADAYGLGAAQVAPVLMAAGCRHFFVATLDEGLALRRILGNGPQIFLLNGLPAGGAPDIIAAGLLPVLDSPPEIEAWQRFGRHGDIPRPAAIQIDTGMSRLGLTAREWQGLIADPDSLRKFPLALLIGHLACGDEPGSPHNLSQLATFRRHLDQARAVIPAGTPISFANSAGIFLGPDYHFDLARPGAALYGLNPQPGSLNPMRQVIRLQGKILQVRDVDAGTPVGYGATHICAHPTRIATIGCGYADGVFRALSNQGAVHLGDHRAPIVGRVSMDLLSIDVGDVPAALLKPGAMVDIIGPRQSPDDLARAAGTIGYEILTALSTRYERRYLPAEPL
jgi:alanine racemase